MNAQNKLGETAMHQCSDALYTEVAEYLMRHNADPTITDLQGRRADGPDVARSLTTEVVRCCWLLFTSAVQCSAAAVHFTAPPSALTPLLCVLPAALAVLAYTLTVLPATLTTQLTALLPLSLCCPPLSLHHYRAHWNAP